MTESECGEVVKTGYLIKSPPLSRAPVSQWHKRWFVLMDSKLVYPMAKRYIRFNYYQSEADAKSLADPKGTIDLGTCVCVVPHTDPIKNFKHVFDVCTEERVYHLSAESGEDKWAWVDTLKDLLFPPKNQKVPKESRSSSGEGAADVVRRLKEDNKPVRPHSFNPSSSGGAARISSRPLPPVPGHVSPAGSPVPADRRKRPLPSPPTTQLSPTPAIHIQPVGIQTSPVSSRRVRGAPPSRPTPYRKNASEPLPPLPSSADSSLLPRSNSSSPPRLLAEDYQEFVASSFSQSLTGQYECPTPIYDQGMLNPPPDSTEDNYSVASSAPRRQLPSRGPRASPAGPRASPAGPRAGPRPSPSPKPSASQKPTKPLKPSILTKPGNLTPSRLAKPARPATPPSRPARPATPPSRPARPVPAARTPKPPLGAPVARLNHSSTARPGRSDDVHDYSLVEEGDEDYSVLEDTGQDYSTLEETEQQDYSVLEEEEQNYSFIGDTGQEHRNIEDMEQDYGNIDNTGQDYRNIEDTEQNYGNIENMEQEYGNVDTGQDYGNIEDGVEEYSTLQASSIPGYNPRDQDYSQLTPTYGTDKSPPPPMRHSSLAPHHVSSHTPPTAPQDYLRRSDLSISHTTRQAPASNKQQPRPRRRQHPPKGGPDYANWPSSSNNDDYSRLNH